VQRTIARLAFPGGKPRPKPGPYRGGGDDAAGSRARNLSERKASEHHPEAGPEQRSSDGVRVSVPDRA
jgi:hypothetical protein